MFVASRREDWRVGMTTLTTADTIEEMERWIIEYTADEDNGSKMFVFQVNHIPVMQYTVIREIRGDSWDGPAEP